MNWIIEKLKRFGDRPAGIEGDRALNYSDFIGRVATLRDQLEAADLPETAVVAIQSSSQLDGLAALIAIGQLKMVALPLAPETSTEERDAKMQICGGAAYLDSEKSDLVLVRADQPDLPQPPALLARLRPLRHSGLILFSSGTSGQPKAMLHDFDVLSDRFKTVGTRNDRTLQLLRIDHIGGLDAALRTLLSGSTLIIPEARTPDAAARAIETHRVNILPASPTFLNLMLLANVPENYDCSSVEIIAYGAESMSPSVLKQLGEAFPGAELQQKFGTSETGAIRIKSTENHSLFFKISDKETEWRIVEDELWIKTPSRILGYLNADNSPLESDGWYRTGDLVAEGPDNSLRIIGRTSAVINVGGQKVHPAEIETVLCELPEVSACQVYARPDPITGNRIECTIVSKITRDIRTWKRTIRSHCRGRLAPWKVPSTIKLASELALSPRLKLETNR